ncbi:unnamed protein product, partial [Ceratitis capitata]
ITTTTRVTINILIMSHIMPSPHCTYFHYSNKITVITTQPTAHQPTHHHHHLHHLL